MVNIFVHIHSKGDSDWMNDYFKFSRVPIEGEFLTLTHDGPWYEIEMVVHTPFDKEIQAEVYAVKVDHMKIMNQKLKTEPGVSFK